MFQVMVREGLKVPCQFRMMSEGWEHSFSAFTLMGLGSKAHQRATMGLHLFHVDGFGVREFRCCLVRMPFEGQEHCIACAIVCLGCAIRSR